MALLEQPVSRPWLWVEGENVGGGAVVGVLRVGAAMVAVAVMAAWRGRGGGGGGGSHSVMAVAAV